LPGVNEAGEWKLEIGNWKMETGKWKLETGRPKLDGCGCLVLKFEISNLKFSLRVSTTRRIRPVQPGGVFGACALATQPATPLPHLINVRGAFRELQFQRIHCVESKVARIHLAVLNRFLFYGLLISLRPTCRLRVCISLPG
jgi:hypothetical protein